MLTLRRSSQYLRAPTSRLACPLGSECVFVGSHFNRSAPPLQFHLTRQQCRPYLFVPVSWGEAKERLERWLEQTQSRIVKVSLLKRQRQNASLIESEFQRRRRKSKNTSKKRRLYSDTQIPAPSSLPLPSSGSQLTSLKSVEIKKAYYKWKMLRETDYQLWKDLQKEQYRGWKSRRQAQYQGWKFRRQAQFQRWKLRRQAQYQQWNVKRNDDWIKRRQVILEEYSKSEWFDELGRPLTARDSTGRFVNPWQSQSTNGVISVGILLRWKWQRFLNFFSKYIYDPMQSSENTTSSPLLGQPVPPLPIPKKSNLQMTWIGHSTCLFQVEKNFTILSDPIFSTRASPYKNIIGVARDVPPAWSIEELMKHHATNADLSYTDEERREQSTEIRKLDICCVTHDHYDHMDRESVIDLKDHVQLWVVPLGIADWLVEKCSIDQKRIVELRWWEQLRLGKKEGRVVVLKSDENEDSTFFREDCSDDQILTVTCCPSSHWAGRTLWDRNTVRKQTSWLQRTFGLVGSFYFSHLFFTFSACGAPLHFQQVHLSSFSVAIQGIPVSNLEHWT